MADLKNVPKRRYAYLDQLDTEKLEELLRTASVLPNDEVASEYYDAIEEVILKRETASPTGRLSDLDSAWEEFQQQYMSPGGQGMRLYPDEEGGTQQKPVKIPAIKGIFRKAILVAATVIALLFCMMVAQAAGIDVFGTLAHWTAETFHMEIGDGPVVQQTNQPSIENEVYQTIQAEVDKCDISVSVVPTWFPDDYELHDIELTSNSNSQSIDCFFLNEDDESFFLTIVKYNTAFPSSNFTVEKDSLPVQEYIGKDKLFYIMTNLENRTAAWSDGSLCEIITGSLTEDQLKMIIDSIGGSNL